MSGSQRPWTVTAWAYAIPSQPDGFCWQLNRGRSSPDGHCYGYALAPDGVAGFFVDFSYQPLNDVTLPGSPCAGLLSAAEGLVSAQAATVAVTFRGQVYRAAVVRVPLGRGRFVGAFEFWFRLRPGEFGWQADTIANETAYNAAGQVIARHGRWPRQDQPVPHNPAGMPTPSCPS